MQFSINSHPSEDIAMTARTTARRGEGTSHASPMHVPPEREPPARIAVIGAAWWSQGWHLPHLFRNPNAEIAAIMQRSEQPTAAKFLNLQLESKTLLRERYKDVPLFGSCEELLADKETLDKVDGVIICTAHACHAEMGLQFLAAGKHVLMEKPMTVDVAEARTLAAAAAANACDGKPTAGARLWRGSLRRLWRGSWRTPGKAF